MLTVQAQSMEMVNQEQWATFLTQFNCHGTEHTPHTLDHIDNTTGEHLATVIYSTTKPKAYWINSHPFSPKRN